MVAPKAAGAHILEEEMNASPLYVGTGNRVSPGTNITAGKKGWLLLKATWHLDESWGVLEALLLTT